MGCPSAGSFHRARVAAPARSRRPEATPFGYPRPEDGRTGMPAVHPVVQLLFQVSIMGPTFVVRFSVRQGPWVDWRGGVGFRGMKGH